MGVAGAEFGTNQPLDKETYYEREGGRGGPGHSVVFRSLGRTSTVIILSSCL